MLFSAVATLVAAAIQSATGLGFAMIAAPALLAVLEPREAITILLVLALLLSGLVLLAERRSPAIRRRDLTIVLVAALPGLVLGVLVLEAITKAQLQVLTGLAVIAAAAIQLNMPEPEAGPVPGGGAVAHPASAAGVGVIVGGLTTSTSVNGPPLALWLFARGASPSEMRDTMAAAFIVLNGLGLAAVALTGEGLSADAGYLALLLPFTALGWLVGRPAFARLRGGGFRTASLLLVLVAGVASLLAGLI